MHTFFVTRAARAQVKYNVTVRNSLQSLYVAKSAVRVGAAAEVGEEQRIFAMKTEFAQLVVSFTR